MPALSRKVGAHVSTAGGLLKAIDNSRKIEANCMQFFAGSPRVWKRTLWDTKDTEIFIKTVSEANLNPVFIHALYLVNLATDNPELLAKSIESLKIDLQNGDLINSAGVIVHLGSHQGRGMESCLKQIASSLNYLLEASASTPILIENAASSKGKVGTLEDIEILLKDLHYHPRIKVCMDTAHLFGAGWDLRSSEAREKLVNEMVDKHILSNLACIHFNDSKAELGSGLDRHENIGEGKIGMDALGEFINTPELADLPIILEVPGFDQKGPDKENIKRTLGLVR